jgi:membrane dipeptidase
MSDEFGTLDLGLSDGQEERAQRLHTESIIVELMFQGPCGYRVFSDEMNAELRAGWEKNHDPVETFVGSIMMPPLLAIDGRLPEYEETWRATGITCTNVQDAGTVRADGGMPDGLLRNTELEALDTIDRATSADEIRAAKAAGRQVAFINYQYLPDEVTLEYLEWSREHGVMMAGLTYNNPNPVGIGCTQANDTGVTSFGAEVVARMNDLGMLVDVSHAGKQTTLDACRLSRTIVIASHTGVEKLHPHPRNKSDDELRAIVDTGGVIGVYAVPGLLTNKPDPNIEAMADHVEYLAELVGVDGIAIGTDWPMQVPQWVLAGPFKQWAFDMGFDDDSLPDPTHNLTGFDDYRDYPNITRSLVKRGYSDDEITRILGLNALRVFDDVWR